MKGLIGISVVLVLTSTAQAAPDARIVCTGEPRLEGVDKGSVLVSTEEAGLVRVVDGVEKGTGEPEGDEAVMSPEAFCAAHQGVDTFILPAPRMIDTPREPDGAEMSPEPQARPQARTADKPADTDDEAEADDAEGEADGVPKSLAAMPALPGSHKSFDPQVLSEPSCSQSGVGQGGGGWWFLMLPLIVGLRRRMEGDR